MKFLKHILETIQYNEFEPAQIIQEVFQAIKPVLGADYDELSTPLFGVIATHRPLSDSAEFEAIRLVREIHSCIELKNWEIQIDQRCQEIAEPFTVKHQELKAQRDAGEIDSAEFVQKQFDLHKAQVRETQDFLDTELQKRFKRLAEDFENSMVKDARETLFRELEQLKKTA